MDGAKDNLQNQTILMPVINICWLHSFISTFLTNHMHTTLAKCNNHFYFLNFNTNWCSQQKHFGSNVYCYKYIWSMKNILICFILICYAPGSNRQYRFYWIKFKEIAMALGYHNQRLLVNSPVTLGNFGEDCLRHHNHISRRSIERTRISSVQPDRTPVPD